MKFQSSLTDLLVLHQGVRNGHVLIMSKSLQEKEDEI